MHVLFFSQGKPSRFAFCFEDSAWRMMKDSSSSAQGNTACMSAALEESRCQVCSFQLRYFASLQQPQAWNSGAHLMRCADAFKDSALFLLFPGQTQAGISVERTLQVMKIFATSFLYHGQILVHLIGVSRCSCLCCASASAHFPPGSGHFLVPAALPAKGRGACSLFLLHPLQAVVLTVLPWKSFLLPCPLPSNIFVKTCKPYSLGIDCKVNCWESCSLRADSVVLLADTNIYC